MPESFFKTNIRSSNAAVFFSNGFKPFFFGSAMIALINIIIWVGYLSGYVEIYSLFAPVEWHLHEMIFGFIGAAIAGFLLTAIPNWTGRPALKGLNLFSLFVLWILGRFAVFYSEYTGAYFTAILDLPYLYILFLYIFREISFQGNRRNYPIALLILLLAIANTLMHVEQIWHINSFEYGYRLSISLLCILIMLIGGRVIPNFTRNWLKSQSLSLNASQLPPIMNKFDIICILTSILTLLLWIFMAQHIITGMLLMVAGGLNFARLSRWKIQNIYQNPILIILQIAFAWLALGLLLLGYFITIEHQQLDIAMHAITVGAFTTMIISIMTRASLGHTGQKIIASKLTIFIYILINLSVVTRLIAPISDVFYDHFLYFSGVVWSLTFILFIYQYIPYYLLQKK